MRKYQKAYTKLPYNPALRKRAAELRKAKNLCEVLIWKLVRNKNFKGYDFDRQKIIGNFIVDFYCVDCNVVIEIDGNSHDNKIEYDEIRESYLIGSGVKIIRVRASDVLYRLSDVLTMLYNHPYLQQEPVQGE